MTRPTILDLDLVVVPREATMEMQVAGNFNHDQSTEAIFSAMLSASPYPTAWDDVRRYVEGLERRLATCEADMIDRIEQCDRMANDWADFCASIGVTWDTHEAVACEIAARAEAAEARIAELEKEKHAALTMIAMLEKRLAKADVVVEPFADGRAKIAHANGCRYHGGHDCDCGKDDYLRAARAYMEGK